MIRKKTDYTTSQNTQITMTTIQIRTRALILVVAAVAAASAVSSQHQQSNPIQYNTYIMMTATTTMMMMMITNTLSYPLYSYCTHHDNNQQYFDRTDTVCHVVTLLHHNNPIQFDPFVPQTAHGFLCMVFLLLLFLFLFLLLLMYDPITTIIPIQSNSFLP